MNALRAELSLLNVVDWPLREHAWTFGFGDLVSSVNPDERIALT